VIFVGILEDFRSLASPPCTPSPTGMAPPQPITVIDPLLWPRSTAMRLALSELVNASQLAANEDGQPPAWIDPPTTDREPRPPFDYVVSFIRFHERGFAAPAGRFLRGMCYHYGVELHNFAPNAISQAATFVGVCEGFLGSPQTGISGSSFSVWSCTRSPRRSRRCATRCSSAACRSRCGRCAGSSTSPAQ
jgi:hypothetical protein